MSTAPMYDMKTSRGVQIPLVRTAINGQLRDTALETSISQHYRNDETETVEGIYTFPLPVGATLLSLEVSLNGVVLTGTVVAAKEAQENYEEAISDGDSALLLQKIDDALYTLNIGNLQPKDTAVVTIQYIQLLSWQQNTLRIMYPTTIGDRYGRPVSMGMEPHQVTGEDPGVEHRADFSLQITGQMVRCPVTCPSHSLAISQSGGDLLVCTPEAGLTMDRDIVISIERPDTLSGSAGYYDPDLDGKWVGWLTLNPKVSNEVGQRNMTIVVDCSGSMAGISIQQAKIAVREIVEQLGDQDWFNIILFGSQAEALFPEPVPCNKLNRSNALKLISGMYADKGGTEIGSALQLAYACAKGLSLKGDILLITDGQSYDVKSVVKSASKSGKRHFTVGVGTAVAEDMLNGLATETGGAFELVSPNEDMAKAIVRHVKRSYAAPLSGSEIRWPTAPGRSIPSKVSHAFSGDTLQLFAQFDEKPEGEAVVRLTFGEQVWTQSFPLAPYSGATENASLNELQLARVCAARRIKDAAADEKQSLGVQYQLQSTRTSYVLVVKREAKDESMMGPAIRAIPQMGKANGRMESMDEAVCDYKDTGLAMGTRPAIHRSTPRRSAPGGNTGEDYFEQIRPACAADTPTEINQDLQMPDDSADRPLGSPTETNNSSSPDDFTAGINRHIQKASLLRAQIFPSALADLESMDLDQVLLALLRKLNTKEAPWKEAELVTMVLYVFMRHPAAARLERKSTRAISKSYKKLKNEAALEDAVMKAFHDEVVSGNWRL